MSQPGGSGWKATLAKQWLMPQIARLAPLVANSYTKATLAQFLEICLQLQTRTTAPIGQAMSPGLVDLCGAVALACLLRLPALQYGVQQPQILPPPPQLQQLLASLSHLAADASDVQWVQDSLERSVAYHGARNLTSRKIVMLASPFHAAIVLQPKNEAGRYSSAAACSAASRAIVLHFSQLYADFFWLVAVVSPHTCRQSARRALVRRNMQPLDWPLTRPQASTPASDFTTAQEVDDAALQAVMAACQDRGIFFNINLSWRQLEPMAQEWAHEMGVRARKVVAQAVDVLMLEQGIPKPQLPPQSQAWDQRVIEIAMAPVMALQAQRALMNLG